MDLKISDIVAYDKLDVLLVTEVTPAYEYADNRATKTQIGFYYNALCEQAGYAQIRVKILGERIPLDCPQKVQFKNLYIGAYEHKGRIRLYARAEGLTVLQDSATAHPTNKKGDN